MITICATICDSGIPLSHGRGGNDPRLASVAVGVGQPLAVKLPVDPDVLDIVFGWPDALAVSEVISALREVSFVVALGCKNHAAKPTCRPNWSSRFRVVPSGFVPVAAIPMVSFQSRAPGVAHPVQSIPDVRSADARSRERDSPDGVTHGLQVSLCKVDPSVCILACNLLSKNRWRSALADKVSENWP